MNNVFWYKKGLRDGIPIALGYFAVSVAIGIAARKAGMNALQSGMMSVLMVASAGQFAAINVIAAGFSYLQMVITTMTVNLRYLLMSSAMSQKLGRELKFRHRLILPLFVTDEIFGIASNTEGELNPFYNYGAATIAVPGWTLGTILGATLGAVLPGRVISALSVALYGMFLAIVIPPAKKNAVIAVLVVVSMGLSYLCSILPGIREISSSMRTTILTLLIAGAAALLKPIDDPQEEADGQ